MDLLRTKPVERTLDADTGLKRELTAFDLVMLGIGAIIGAGIFVLTGISAATHAGPAVVLSFVVAGIACACAALSYAELASSVGGCGSAYGYGYAGLGEFAGWVIGWMLLAEYAIAVAAVAVGWSGYLANGLQTIGMPIPAHLLHGPLDPQSPGLINLPAALLLAFLAVLIASGAKVSARVNMIIVFVKLATILLFIAVALPHVDAANWTPFIPPVETAEDGSTRFGVMGIFAGAAIVFFAYIGFDAVSTSAEETRHPQRDLPIGIIGSLLVCTVLYIAVSGLLTGIVNYRELNVPSPVAHALLRIGENWAAGLISIGAIAGLTTVCLVMYFALTRLLFAICRDGLLPRSLATIHPRTGTPTRIVVLVGIIMIGMSGFVPLDKLAHLVNISTLAAFVVVCAGVIALRRTRADLPRPFKVPLYPFVPLLGIVVCIWLMLNLPWVTWLAFALWMALGLAIYFLYSYSHSELARKT
ncbi:amino acid/polyamine/organocation transporter, APC superfamily [Fontimonas thermophila]|uniref:Amino acid/polyamine/organocation transporter, APC superfamily n=1 Tax=Fontimonas thermophila TaxID=1076937 RepID=A0A1I2J6E2_9GAMM|nr:amino acid permease [Fontimonas thermophila]SFF48261.1 amino acid/polyamine/organocation transporter, APC superfamily [Fontimonas thermophila]